jgi:transglutaminase-like putative cysteine protease
VRAGLALACLLASALAAPAAAGTHPVHRWLAWNDELAPALPELDELLAAPRERQSPSAGYVDRLIRVTLTLETDGTVVTRHVRMREFTNDDGVRGSGNLRASARAELEELRLLAAFVRQPDGTVTGVDPASLQVLTRNEDHVFSDVWDVVVPLPELRIGSRAVLVSESRLHGSRWPFAWSRIFYLGDIAPVRRFEALVQWRDDALAPSHATNDGALSCQAGGRQIRCVRDDVPALEPDPDVESYHDLVPHLLFTREPTWASLLARTRELVAAAAEPSPALAERAAALVRGAENDRERAERLLRFVADEIRYVGLEHGADGVVPAAATATLARRYGDCKGKVALLLALAKAAGIAGEPMLVATALHDTARLLAPSADYFDHMIACLDVGQVERWCVDPTAADLPAHLLPEAIAESVGLARAGGEARLVGIASPSFARELRLEAENRVTCEGAIEETLTRTYRGYWAAHVRSTLKPLTSDRRHTEVVAAYRDVMGEKAEPATRVYELDDPRTPLVIETRTTFGSAVGPETTYYREPDFWLAFYLGQLTTRNRVHPYRFPGLDFRSRHTFELCPDWKVLFHGPTLAFESRWGSVERSYAIEGSRVVVDTRVLIARRLLAGEERTRMNALLSRVSADTRIWFRIAPAGAD